MGFFNGLPLESEGTFVSRFMIQLVFILVLPRLLHWAFLSRLLQPRVISEIVSGIVLGPSCLGQIAGFTDLFFPSRSIPYLQALGALAVVLFMFMTGCHLKPEQLWGYKFRAICCSVCAIGCTFAVAPGVVMLFDDPAYSNFNYAQLLVLIPILLSVPAEAVMARILAERGLLASKLGSWCMATDSLGLVICFILLATLLSMYGAENPWEPPADLCPGTVAVTPNDAESLMDPLWIVLVFFGFVALLVTIFRLIFVWIGKRVSKKGRMEAVIFVAACVLTFSVAWFTQTLTLSSLLGPLFLGLMSVPRTGSLAHDIEAALGPITVGIILPVFFALVGLKTDFTLLTSGDVGLAFALVGILWGTTFVGAFAAATLFTGFQFKNFYFASLRTCKGLTALTIFNILSSAGAITDRFYALVVLYALISCALVSPVVWLGQQLSEWWEFRQSGYRVTSRKGAEGEEGGEGEKTDDGKYTAQHILVTPLSSHLSPVAATLAAWISTQFHNPDTEVLFCRFLDDFDTVEQYIPLLQTPIPPAIIESDTILGPCQVRWNGLRPVGTAICRAVLAPSLESTYRKTAQGVRKGFKHQPFNYHILGYNPTEDAERLIVCALKMANAHVFVVTGQHNIALAGSHSALVITSAEGTLPQYLMALFEQQSNPAKFVYWSAPSVAPSSNSSSSSRRSAPSSTATADDHHGHDHDHDVETLEARPPEIEHCQTLIEVLETLAENPPSFDVVFCPMPATTPLLLAQLEAACQCPIPVIFESTGFFISDRSSPSSPAHSPELSHHFTPIPRVDIDDESKSEE